VEVFVFPVASRFRCRDVGGPSWCKGDIDVEVQLDTAVGWVIAAWSTTWLFTRSTWRLFFFVLAFAATRFAFAAATAAAAPAEPAFFSDFFFTPGPGPET